MVFPNTWPFDVPRGIISDCGNYNSPFHGEGVELGTPAVREICCNFLAVLVPDFRLFLPLCIITLQSWLTEQTRQLINRLYLIYCVISADSWEEISYTSEVMCKKKTKWPPNRTHGILETSNLVTTGIFSYVALNIVFFLVISVKLNAISES